MFTSCRKPEDIARRQAKTRIATANHRQHLGDGDLLTPVLSDRARNSDPEGWFRSSTRRAASTTMVVPDLVNVP